MADKVYAVRILVETYRDAETVESKVRGWGEATFDGFVLLELEPVKASLVGIDTLAHTIAALAKSQQNIQESLETVTTAFEKTSRLMQKMINTYTQVKNLGEATTEEDEDETAHLLFNIVSTEIADELDAGIISDQLRQAFKHHNIILSASASVAPLKAELPTWQISNEGRFYSIRNQEALLRVYEFSCCLCERSLDISKPNEAFYPMFGGNTVYCPLCFGKGI